MNPSKRERWVRLANLSGLITEETGMALANLASEVPEDRAIVEVGSFKGKSTAYLAEGSRLGHGARVYAVDPWDLQESPGKWDYNNPETRKAFDAQLRSLDLRSFVTAKKGFSTDVASKWKSGPIGLLYIDGDHEEQSVTEDFEAWFPHLHSEASIAFDDYGTPRNPGVKRFVDRLTKLGKTEVTGTLAVLRLR